MVKHERQSQCVRPVKLEEKGMVSGHGLELRTFERGHRTSSNELSNTMLLTARFSSILSGSQLPIDNECPSDSVLRSAPRQTAKRERNSPRLSMKYILEKTART